MYCYSGTTADQYGGPEGRPLIANVQWPCSMSLKAAIVKRSHVGGSKIALQRIQTRPRKGRNRLDHYNEIYLFIYLFIYLII